MNKANFYIGIAWCAFWFGLVILDVGEMTKGPYLIHWYDAIWIPFITAIFPFYLGMSVYKKRKEK